jgi:hypothetical protein
LNYNQIRNPSKDRTMLATLRIPGYQPRVIRVGPAKPPDYGILPVHGEVQWHLWTLEWENAPRAGLCRFGR